MNKVMNVRSVQQLIEQVRRGAQPRYLHFWGHRPSKSGVVTKACFSQWYEAPFSVDGICYPTAEHFMMSEKARTFGDDAIRARVQSARTPGEAKALGRQVSGFDEGLWHQVRFSIVVAANQAKFSQSPNLRDFLMNTGAQVLVETSPVDSIWGIGLAADHPDATKPELWPGLNLLGFALMEVRDSLSNMLRT